MTIGLNLPIQILNTQAEAMKEENINEENLCGMNKDFETRLNGRLCIEKQSCLPHFGGLMDLIMHESHMSMYSIYPGSDKMYDDLKKLYWWPNMKAKIATYVSKCLTCSKSKLNTNNCLKEEVFRQLDDFVDPDFPNHVYHLKKALYGLKQDPRARTPMATTKLDADLQGTKVDQTKYRSMIGVLIYLTASQQDIAFTTFVCARYQARLTEKHLKEVKKIFRYLRQTIYLKDYGFKIIPYSDADLVGCNDDGKSTSGGIQFMGDKLVSWSSKKKDCTAMSIAKAEYVS
uniref:Uncharacterized mitochondrial protein AtMg00810-like n=1 Tax=Tanacetum cinerariifolium TaxID=118510 RepID=A0A6L2KHK8_TANCI|nr:uncharacterized mitochondrial protein AtMg00810-like [Tanacetum cinerariifolium]